MWLTTVCWNITQHTGVHNFTLEKNNAKQHQEVLGGRKTRSLDPTGCAPMATGLGSWLRLWASLKCKFKGPLLPTDYEVLGQATPAICSQLALWRVPLLPSKCESHCAGEIVSTDASSKERNQWWEVIAGCASSDTGRTPVEEGKKAGRQMFPKPVTLGTESWLTAVREMWAKRHVSCPGRNF